MSETNPAAPGAEAPQITGMMIRANSDLHALIARMRKSINRVRVVTDAAPAGAPTPADKDVSLLSSAEGISKNIAEMNMLVDELEKFI